MSKKLAKKTRVTLSISARDLSHLVLMLRLHSADADKRSHDACAALSFAPGQEAERARLMKVSHSWLRAERKAREFAAQFEHLAREATAGSQCMLPALARIR